MKNLGKSIVIFILARVINLIHVPLIFNFTHFSRREKAVRHFVEENKLPLEISTKELVSRSLQYYRMFKRLNMFFLLVGIYTKDIEVFKKTMGNAQISGLDILEKHKNKSVIGISFHIGPFSMIPLILALKGYNSNVLARSDTFQEQTKMTIEEANERWDFLAEKYNVGKIHFIDALSTFSFIQIRKRMQSGDILMIHPDTAKESSVSSIPVDFFNTRIAGHVGIAKIIRFTKPAVLPFSIRWDAGGDIHLKIEDSLDINPDSTDEDLIEAIYAPFEKRVAANPEQWIQIENYEEFKY